MIIYILCCVCVCRSSFIAGLAGAIASNPIDVVKVTILSLISKYTN